MKSILIIFLLILGLSIKVSAQQDSIETLKRLNPYARERIREDVAYIPKDTIKLYLEDTLYYVEYNMFYEFDNKLGYFKYFKETYGLEFKLRDSLPDGFYCLYNLTRKQVKNIKDKERYLVASGEFKNGMKQGIFKFKNEPEDTRFPIAHKEIMFKNDTVHGMVREVKDGKVLFLGEYKMGVKDGFFFIENDGYPAIFLYEDGEKIKETFFNSWDYFE